MKNILLFLALSPMLLASQPISNSKRAQAKDELAFLYKVIPHTPISDFWKTVLLFRNDQDRDITLRLNFYDSAGNSTLATFYDIENDAYETNEYDLIVPAFGIKTIEFDALPSPLISAQVFVTAADNDLEFSVETLLHNFEGQGKVATVGVIDQQPFFNFFMNVDRRLDPYTEDQKIRGLAVTNTGLATCECKVDLIDEFNTVVGTEYLTISSSGKWVGRLDTLFNGMDNILPLSVGLINVECDQQVSALGLAFEPPTPIVGSIPVDYYEVIDGKKIVRKR